MVGVVVKCFGVGHEPENTSRHVTERCRLIPGAVRVVRVGIGGLCPIGVCVAKRHEALLVDLLDGALIAHHEPPLAVAGILEAVIRGGEISLEEGLALEYRAVERTSGSKDTIEGVRAFFEKRKPVFTGE